MICVMLELPNKEANYIECFIVGLFLVIVSGISGIFANQDRNKNKSEDDIPTVLLYGIFFHRTEDTRTAIQCYKSRLDLDG